jgi:hypothetical protein
MKPRQPLRSAGKVPTPAETRPYGRVFWKMRIEGIITSLPERFFYPAI